MGSSVRGRHRGSVGEDPGWRSSGKAAARGGRKEKSTVVEVGGEAGYGEIAKMGVGRGEEEQ